MQAEVPAPSLLEPEVPESLDRVTLACLEREEKGRTRSARELAEALEKAASQAGLLASSSEVEDRLKELFADRIARKKKLISELLAASVGEPRPLTSHDLRALPKLQGEASSSPSPSPKNKSASLGPLRTAHLAPEETPAPAQPAQPAEARTNPGGPKAKERRSLEPPPPAVPAEPSKSPWWRSPLVSPLLGILGMLAGGALVYLYLLPKEAPPIGEQGSGSAPVVAEVPQSPPSSQVEGPAPARGGEAEASGQGGEASERVAGGVAGGEAEGGSTAPEPAPEHHHHRAHREEGEPAEGEGQEPVEVGYLSLATNPWTHVRLGDQELGVTPLIRQELPAGTHQLRLINEGAGIDLPYRVVIEGGQTLSRRLGLGDH
jgi:hypothetical protein